MSLSETLSRIAQEPFCVCVSVVCTVCVRVYVCVCVCVVCGVCLCLCWCQMSVCHAAHQSVLWTTQTCHSISQFDVCVRSEFYKQWRHSVFLLCSPHQPQPFWAVGTQHNLYKKLHYYFYWWNKEGLYSLCLEEYVEGIEPWPCC